VANAVIKFSDTKMRLWLRNLGVALASDRQDIIRSLFVRELIVREGHKLRLAFLQSVTGPGNKKTTEQSLHLLKTRNGCAKYV